MPREPNKNRRELMFPGITTSQTAREPPAEDDDMGELGERVAVVEVRVDGLEKVIGEIKPELTKVSRTVTRWNGALVVLTPLLTAGLGAFCKWMGWM